MANKFTLILAALCAMTACRAPQPLEPAGATTWIPDGMLVLAGLDVAKLRTSPLAAKLPLDAYAGASSALIASDGKDLLVVTLGHFTQPPAGSVLAEPGVALFGSARLVARAQSQHKLHATGAPSLVALSNPVANHPIWLVAQGGVPLPLTGNAANLNHVMRNAQSVAMSADIDSGIALAITAEGKTEDAARNIEETLRAQITLGAAALTRQPDLAKLLRSIQIDRTAQTVRITLQAGPDTAAKLIQALAP